MVPAGIARLMLVPAQRSDRLLVASLECCRQFPIQGCVPSAGAGKDPDARDERGSESRGFTGNLEYCSFSATFSAGNRKRKNESSTGLQ